ncbi:MAG: rhodanese-like domain-containing protein [Flavobacteriaceae bacterium]|nr:rhodanese-like domain-containing protein [Bacteroidia bacterium]NNK83770.1 rhodanese-like domain-containing protein [Flavobacteriaceae bacterium]
MKKLLIISFLMVFVSSCEQKVYKEIQLVTPEEMKELMLLEDVQLIDVRSPREYEKGFIEGFQNIDYMSDTFSEDIEKLDKTRPVLLYCKTGRRTAKCAKKLVENGFVKIYDLKGGITQWKFKGFEIKTQ